MKKLIATTLALTCSGFVWAVEPATDNVSSFTKTNDSGACIVISTGPGGSPVVTPRYLDKVIVGGASGTGSNIVLYNSTFTTTPIISSISLNTVFVYDFGNTKIKGICYTTQGNTAGVTIIYKK